MKRIKKKKDVDTESRIPPKGNQSPTQTNLNRTRPSLLTGREVRGKGQGVREKHELTSYIYFRLWNRYKSENGSKEFLKRQIDTGSTIANELKWNTPIVLGRAWGAREALINVVWWLVVYGGVGSMRVHRRSISACVFGESGCVWG